MDDLAVWTSVQLVTIDTLYIGIYSVSRDAGDNLAGRKSLADREG